MKFLLGCETITAIDDGGLGIRYNTGDGYIDFQPGGIRPVLCLEVYTFILRCLISRQNDASPNEEMILNSSGNTLVKSSLKCSAKPATKNSTKDAKWNIKR